ERSARSGSGELANVIGVVPVCIDDSRPSNMTVVRNLKFVAGSGRRYMEITCVSLQPYGFWIRTTSKSRLAGISSAIRINPLVRRRLYAAERPASVETSISRSQFEPSFVRKIGSRPPDSSNLAWTCAADTDIASLG